MSEQARAFSGAESTADPDADFRQAARRQLNKQADSSAARSNVVMLSDPTTAFKRALMLSASERSQLIANLADSLGAEAPSLGVEKTEGVCGGSACLVRTRITVWSLIAYVRQGATDDLLLSNFPSLRAADLHSARLYASRHGEEIERELRENEPGD